MKNVQKPIEVYAISDGILALPEIEEIQGKGKLLSIKGEMVSVDGVEEIQTQINKKSPAKDNKLILIVAVSLLLLMGSYIIYQQFENYSSSGKR